MRERKTLGLAAVTGSYVLWGFLTIFWSFLSQANSVYILAHRVIWSLVFMGLYLVVTRQWREVVEAFRSRQTMLNCLLCGILITLNWGVYIYAVNSGHVLQASLGVLHRAGGGGPHRGSSPSGKKPRWRRPSPSCARWGGIVFLTLRTGTFPTLALLVAVPFAVYGGLKKRVTLTAQTSLFVETLWVTPGGAALLRVVDGPGGGTAAALGARPSGSSPACGVATSVPLLLFNRGVKEIPYYVAGILMYINPTLQFLVGLLYFHEALDVNQFLAFCIIWVGLAVTMADRIRRLRQEKRDFQASLRKE